MQYTCCQDQDLKSSGCSIDFFANSEDDTSDGETRCANCNSGADADTSCTITDNSGTGRNTTPDTTPSFPDAPLSPEMEWPYGGLPCNQQQLNSWLGTCHQYGNDMQPTQPTLQPQPTQPAPSTQIDQMSQPTLTQMWQPAPPLQMPPRWQPATRFAAGFQQQPSTGQGGGKSAGVTYEMD